MVTKKHTMCMTIRQFWYDTCSGIIDQVTSTYVGVGHSVGVGHGVRDYFLGKCLSMCLHY